MHEVFTVVLMPEPESKSQKDISVRQIEGERKFQTESRMGNRMGAREDMVSSGIFREFFIQSISAEDLYLWGCHD